MLYIHLVIPPTKVIINRLTFVLIKLKCRTSILITDVKYSCCCMREKKKIIININMNLPFLVVNPIVKRA